VEQSLSSILSMSRHPVDTRH